MMTFQSTRWCVGVPFALLLCLASLGWSAEKGMVITDDGNPSGWVSGGLPGRYAVVVGISKYKNASYDLQFAEKDATAFYEFLLSPQGGRFSRDNVRLLLNQQATSSALRSAVGTFLGRTKRDDLVVIYFSGHGCPTPRNRKDLYLMTYEADPDDLAGTAFPMDEFKRYANKSIGAERVVMFTDTCYSGGIRLMGQNGQQAGAPLYRYLQRLSKSRGGLVSITASSGSQVSIEDSKFGGGHGVFTYYMLKGLTRDSLQNDKNEDGVVDVAELYTYVRDKVSVETDSRQVPSVTGDLTSGIPLSATISGTSYESSKPLSVVMGMFRELENGLPYKLENGETLFSGDGYFFCVRANRSCFVYMFQEDASGAVFRIFPNTKYNTVGNYVPPGMTVLVPNAEQAFYLDDTVGRERIYLFATTKREKGLEAFMSGTRRGLEKECLRLMGPAGVRMRSIRVQRERFDQEIGLSEFVSRDGFAHVMDFFHK